jgi:tetratricopeptide (TPR) repeat protein
MVASARFAVPLFALGLLAGCCGVFQSPEEKYEKEMECASRITDERSVEILSRGTFCCEPLPKGTQGLPEARRFYLNRAWALKPTSADPPLAIAKSYWDEGSYFEGLRHYDAARERMERPLMAVVGEVTMYRLLKNYAEAGAWVRWIRRQKAIDAAKVADYLEARLLYDEGKYAEARPLFESAVARNEKGNDYLGDTPFTMKDARFYLAQIRRKTGDPLGAHEEFLLYLKKMSDPDFQIFYAFWVPKIGSDQAQLYDKIEKEWAHVRQ